MVRFGFKVKIKPDEKGFREWTVYRWDREMFAEIPVASGAVRGGIEAAQNTARKYIQTILRQKVTA